MEKKREREVENQAQEVFDYLTSHDDIILRLDDDCEIPDSFKKGDVGSTVGNKYKVWILPTNKISSHNVSFSVKRPNGERRHISVKLLEQTAAQNFRICLADVNQNNNQEKWKEFRVLYPKIEKEVESVSPKKAVRGPESVRIAKIASKSTPKTFIPVVSKSDIELERKALEYALNNEALKEKAIQMLVERHSAEVEKEAQAAKERAKDKIVADMYKEVVSLPTDSPKVKYLWKMLRDKFISEMDESDKEQLQNEAWDGVLEDKKRDLLKTRHAEIEELALNELKEEIKIKEMKKSFVVNPEKPVSEKELSEVRLKAKNLFDQQLFEIQEEMK